MDSILYTVRQELNALSCMADSVEGYPDPEAMGGGPCTAGSDGEERPYPGWLVPPRWRRLEARGGTRGN